MFEGKGKLMFKDGRKYEGDFCQGKREGNGTLIMPNGNKYSGMWKNDVKHGMGIWYNHKTGSK